MTLPDSVVVGIDVGGTNTLIGFVDAEANILCRKSLSTKEYFNPQDFVIEVVRIIHYFFDENKNFKLKGIGIGAPNGNIHHGTIDFAPNLEWKGIIPLVELFAQYFETEIILTNDANAAALGEKIYGGAKAMDDFIFITLGTGVGSGIVSNGKLVYGYQGFAGELGHVIVVKDGRKCACGRKGCLEAYCSAGGLVKTYKELLSETVIAESDKEFSAQMVYEKAKTGDIYAQKAFLQTADLLGFALANFVAFSNPQAIFLFGGLAKAADLMLEPIKEAMENNLLQIYKGKVQLLCSSLPETDAAILGAAALIGN